MINLFQPSIGDAELDAIRDVFSSNWLGSGERVERFERAFADYVGCAQTEVLAVSSCTEGLFQAVLGLGLGPGDEVVLPAISFIGAAHAVRSAGAKVVLCDVDPATLNPTVEQVARVFTPRTRGALILHYGGQPGAVVEISELARSRCVVLIEDAACALGSFAGGRACGTFGDVGVWSFDSMKLLTTGDGGMVWCKSQATAERIRNGVRLGVASSGYDRRSDASHWWEIDPEGIGRRGTMNDIAGAMGSVQLKRVPAFLRRRSDIAAAYDAAFAGLPWLTPSTMHASGVAQTFYWIRTTPELRDRLAAYLLDREIYTSFRYWPLHRTQMYGSDDVFSGADRAAATTLLLPLHQGLSDADIDRITDTISNFAP
jgi:dTDP-4-amino-4,6-dideoxygalactose transaminase